MTTTVTAETTPATGLDHLEIQGVKKVFGDNTAIERLDLSVHRGEFLSLLGPSGCGKTTLLRMIAGFETPTDGAILLSGKDIVSLPPHRRPVNTVFQSYLLFPHMNIADNIAYGLKQAKVPKPEIAQRVREVLALVQMEDFAGRKPEQLSGGQQQRIALARALVNRPQVLLLDEPMSALDRKLREEMQLELKRLHTKLDTTFVFVTHDQDEALAMSDRIVVMYDGVIQQIGTGEDIYANPTNGFVAGFIGKQNFIPAEVASIDYGTARLRTANTVLEVPSLDLRPATAAGRTETLRAGERVRAAIRPERIRVAPAGQEPATANTARGTVMSYSFLGDVIQYMITVGDNDEILARVPAAGSTPLSADAEVDLSWDADAVAVYGCEGGSSSSDREGGA
ncbi:ABC transporter ATP-binding protein [Brevibacterium renqingii]|uniref:ABC transporter ATP-binding protein n=1 Tax=Brevibacterium renqingii TaxID=2776916 RepID=UPI001AE0150B|nr:ABC transporter ATP-binding protein [Brevibacterium renqingii]